MDGMEEPQTINLSYKVGPARWVQWTVFAATLVLVLLSGDCYWEPILPTWVGDVALLGAFSFFVVSILYTRWKVRQLHQWLAQPTPTDTPDDIGLSSEE